MIYEVTLNLFKIFPIHSQTFLLFLFFDIERLHNLNLCDFILLCITLYLNYCSSFVSVIESGSDIFSNDSHPLNISYPKVFTEEGIST